MIIILEEFYLCGQFQFSPLPLKWLLALFLELILLRIILCLLFMVWTPTLKELRRDYLVRNFSCSCFNNSRLYTHPLNPSCHFNFILILGNLREADLIGTLRFQNSEIVFLHWWNSSTDDSIIYRKLDMILVNDTWLNCFPIYMENFPLSWPFWQQPCYHSPCNYLDKIEKAITFFIIIC